jgi:hypothetical protein
MFEWINERMVNLRNEIRIKIHEKGFSKKVKFTLTHICKLEWLENMSLSLEICPCEGQECMAIKTDFELTNFAIYITINLHNFEIWWITAFLW